MVTCALPPEVLDALPARAEREQDWQSAIILALPHLVPVHLHRQNAGRVITARGGAVRGAPVGAADITGWARGGLRIEIECKMPARSRTVAQRTWAAACRAWGVVYMLAVYDGRESLTENVLVTARMLRSILAARAVDVEAATQRRMQ